MTGTYWTPVTDLLRRFRATLDFDMLPILADALDDACDERAADLRALIARAEKVISTWRWRISSPAKPGGAGRRTPTHEGVARCYRGLLKQVALLFTPGWRITPKESRAASLRAGAVRVKEWRRQHEEESQQ